MIPYGRQAIDDEDIQAVCEVLRSDYLTTGPKIDEFEQAIADYVGAKYAVAVCNGTAALHCAMAALGIGKGDEVIVPAMTFAATANCVCYQGGIPVFADVDPQTLLIDPNAVEKKITGKTRAIIGVDYAGQPCAWDSLKKIAEKYDLALVADGCHALGAAYKDRMVGTIAGLNVFSFHPVKHIATGEGGMITTDSKELARKMRFFRNHGITTDARQREKQGSWFYEMTDLGFNYRITDIQCALGISQLKKLPEFLARRREIAKQYDNAFSAFPGINPLAVNKDVLHAYHLYVVKINFREKALARASVFKALREKGIAANVHYIPVHLHPYYRNHLGTKPGDCPRAEAAYENIISLPIYPKMTDEEVKTVIEQILKAVNC